MGISCESDWSQEFRSVNFNRVLFGIPGMGSGIVFTIERSENIDSRWKNMLEKKTYSRNYESDSIWFRYMYRYTWLSVKKSSKWQLCASALFWKQSIRHEKDYVRWISYQLFPTLVSWLSAILFVSVIRSPAGFMKKMYIWIKIESTFAHFF